VESLARVDPLRAFGPYRELAWIAQGPVAQVYRAWDSRRQEWVALKVLAPAFALHDPDGRHLREASAAARAVRHPHLLPLLDAGAHDGRLYLAMPYMAGGTLAQPLPAARTVGQLLRLLYQVCQALAQAHQQAPPLVHGNLKPSNLLLPRAEYILVAELGVAASLPLDLAARARRGLLGTLAYTAPELALHGAASPQADIYALGVVLFELLTGRLPFEGPTPLAVLYGHALAPVPSAGALNPTLTPAWEAVLQRALAKEPAARYPSVDALYAALYAAYQGLGGACVRLPDPPKGPRVAAAPAPPVGPDAVALAAARYPDAATHLAAARRALAPRAAPSGPAATSAAPGTRGRGWPRGWWLLATVLAGLLALGALLLARR
jgi:serine/threonine-protein kinase